MVDWLGLRRVGLERAVSGALLSLLAACSGADRPSANTPPDPHQADALSEVFENVGEACPRYGASASGPEAQDQLFVEAVLVDAPSELARQASLPNLQELARSPRAQFVTAPHVIGTFDKKAEMALGPADGSSAAVTLSRWSMVPHHIDAEASSLDLELDLSAASPNGSPLTKTLRFSVTTRDNEPRLANLVWNEADQRSLLVLFRTFRIHGEAQLRAIFECKMQQRARYLQRLRARARESQ